MHVNTIISVGEEEEEEDTPRYFSRRSILLLFVAVFLAIGLGLLGAFLSGVLVPPGTQNGRVSSGNTTQHSACWMPGMDMGPDCP